MSKPGASKDVDRPLISNATILILSGFLIGLTVDRFVAEDLSPYLLACGLTGILAFIGLELAAERRIHEMAQAEQQSIARRLERHVGHHLPEQPHDALKLFGLGGDRDDSSETRVSEAAKTP